MHAPYLEVTFREGRAIAAYYYLPRSPGATASRTHRLEPGLVVDYDHSDTPIGIEITAPRALTLEAFNRVLVQLGQPPIAQAEFAPLRAA
jgi:hypothetical protein